MAETKERVFIEGDVTLYAVEIEGRGGDSSRVCFFEEEEVAILASALDGKNYTPDRRRVWKLSNGYYIQPAYFHITPAPSEADVAKLRSALTPAQKTLLGRNTL